MPSALLLLLLASSADRPLVAREVRVVMGTTAEVRVAGLAAAVPALDAAFAALGAVDDAMSLWKPSELTRLNAHGWAHASPALMAVLVHSLDVAAASRGAFDPTVEPLVRAMGGLGGPRRRLPDGERRQLCRVVGYHRVQVDAAAGEIRLEPGTRLDLGGIAKGYAADLALAALKAAGAAGGLVDLGGSSLGVFGTPLTVEIRDPHRPDSPGWGSFRLDEGAVSTSGGDQKPGHILDPRTGRPAAGVLAVTVVAATGLEADALSTAVYVLGADAGLRLLARRGAVGFVLQEEGGQRVIHATPGFAAARSLTPADGIRLRE
ncbi:MAG TPA: FAD:protein FMN transferase [Vicinamibacteria bacterium]|jgi:thiamine biosynthesis lipoprotein